MRRLGTALISFSLNIAGPIKNNALLRRAFLEGLKRLDEVLTAAGLETVERHQTDSPTGCEALWAVRGDGRQIKRLCVGLEDRHPIGRIFDMDVLDPVHEKWDRADLMLPPRGCLVCGCKGKNCASRRLHSVAEIQQVTTNLLRNFFAEQDRCSLADLASRSLLYEVCTTPKPGLVDCWNNGSHCDMNLFTFLDSTCALLPYFRRAVSVGQETADLPPEETFLQLRPDGVGAERAMLQVTGGVNTHKGAIFSLGTVCAAVGRLWNPASFKWNISEILRECAAMTRRAALAELDTISPDTASTAGNRVYIKYGIRGIRGELAAGLPAVEQIGLPALNQALAGGASLDEAGVSALLALMASVTDTNLIARGGMEGWQWVVRRTRDLLLSDIPPDQAASVLDTELIQRNLSPGGCADLLAITYFLYFLQHTSPCQVECVS